MEAEKFKRKRISLGLNQTELAEMLDVKPNTVSRYETGILGISKTVELALEAIERKIMPLNEEERAEVRKLAKQEIFKSLMSVFQEIESSNASQEFKDASLQISGYVKNKLSINLTE